jgi:hypothetical protein
MGTIVAPPPTATPATSAPRRRPIRWVAIAVVVLLVGGLVGIQAYLLRYQPLSANGTGSSWADTTFATRIGDFSSPSGEDFAAYDVTYQDGRTFRFAFTIGNLGTLPVTIDSVALPGCDGCVDPLEYVSTSIAPASGPNMFDHTRSTPFQPFELGRNGYRVVEIATRFSHCEAWGRGTSSTYSIVEVRYHTGWVHHTIWLTLPYTLGVRFTASSCPD